MSKLGKKSILLPKESTIKVEGDSFLVSGPKGSQKILLIKIYFHPKLMKKMNFKFHLLKRIKIRL